MTLFSADLKKQGTDNRIAITGGRGRLARLMASFFRKAGYDVVLFSRIEEEGFQALSDLFDPAVVATFGAIIHAAWSTVPFTSEADVGREEREDLPLLKKLLESITLATKQGNSPRFLFLSSASLYGNTTKEPATEKATPHPLSRYAQAKLTAEEIILQAAVSFPQFHPIILRITNVIGFLSNPQYPQGILPRIIAAAREQEAFTIWGDGRCSKDYLWIDDFLSALQAALTKPISGIFNLGSGENFSILELAFFVEQALDVVLLVNYQERYSWDVAYSYIDSSKFSQATGWKPMNKILEQVKNLCLKEGSRK